MRETVAGGPFPNAEGGMAWFNRMTRFGNFHSVYAQEAEDSCGIACVMMCVYKINKLSPNKEASYVEDQIYNVYGRQAHTSYNGSSYTYAEYLAATLNQLNCGAWQASYVGPNAVADAMVDTLGVDIVGGSALANALMRGKPIITLVNWTDNGGGHFVVVDTVNNLLGSLYASVCDPWDGDVHVVPFKQGTAFRYVGRQQPFAWDTGGKKHAYAADHAGGFNGWVVRPVSP